MIASANLKFSIFVACFIVIINAQRRFCPNNGVSGGRCNRSRDCTATNEYCYQRQYCCTDNNINNNVCRTNERDVGSCSNGNQCPRKKDKCRRGRRRRRRCCRDESINPPNTCLRNEIAAGSCLMDGWHPCRQGETCRGGTCCRRNENINSCLHNEIASGPCSTDGWHPCRQGETCRGRTCCRRNNENNNRCDSNEEDMGPCLSWNRCSGRATCKRGRCCRARDHGHNRCQSGRDYGACAFGFCFFGGQCINGRCCDAVSNNRCPNGHPSHGPCGQPGQYCNHDDYCTSNSICCPRYSGK